MNRLASDMTAAELVAWSKRHGLTWQKAADALGISIRQYTRYRQGDQIPLTIAIICDIMDELAATTSDRITH